MELPSESYHWWLELNGNRKWPQTPPPHTHTLESQTEGRKTDSAVQEKFMDSFEMDFYFCCGKTMGWLENHLWKQSGLRQANARVNQFNKYALIKLPLDSNVNLHLFAYLTVYRDCGGLQTWPDSFVISHVPALCHCNLARPFLFDKSQCDHVTCFGHWVVKRHDICRG